MKKSNQIKWSALIACLTITPITAYAQFDTGPDTTPWTSFHLNKSTRVQLNFKNTSIDLILQFLSKASGVVIVKDPSLKDSFTVTTPSKVDLNTAFSVVNTVLSLRNYNIVKDGSILVVRPKAAPAAPSFPTNFNPGAGREQGPQMELRVYKIQYANAASVATTINEVFAPVAGQPAQPQPAFFRGRFQPPQPQGGPAGGVSEASVKASSDDFSNSVIVNATAKDQDQVKALIDDIDKQTDAPQLTRVYKLTYANANDIAPVIQNVLVSNAPTGRGGAGNTQVNIGQRFQAAFRFGGNAQASFGNVVADQRTNSIVVTATAENLKTVDQVIQNLDKPVTIQDTTFVFPLQNAKADQVATLFQETFGNRQGVSGGGFNANTTTLQRSTAYTPFNLNLANRANLNGNGTGPGGDNLQGQQPVAEAQTPQQKDLSVALQDPNATSGALLTSVTVQGRGGFFQALQGGNGQNQTGLQTGLGPNGQLINTRDISGQISVIPDINTNSVIVVAPPDAIPLVKQILGELDKIPEQVVIETTIVEATLDKKDQFGLEYKFNQLRVGGDPNKTGSAQDNFGLQSASPALQGFSYTLTGGDLSAFFNMLKTDTKFQILSTPRIFTSNNVTAQINVSQNVPYITNTTTNAVGNLTFSYGFKTVGIVLTVTPRITANGMVTMDIDQSADDLQGFTTFNAPIINQREATTTVSVDDGKTVVLGGIIQNQVTATTNKIPLLGDIPILGNIFRSTSHDNQKTELLIFMTPHIITNSDDATKYRDKTIKQMSKETQNDIKKVVDPANTTTPPVKKP